ncbi:MAG TPA: hypothetical protein VGJ84_21000 [Polyangiaceae bacterium]
MTSALVVLFASGCSTAERYRLKQGEAYCGSLVGSPLFQEGLLPRDIPPNLRMRLELDVDHLTSSPGLITTDDSDRGLCRATASPLFSGAPLRAIDELMHDSLSTLEFGDGREQNLITWVDSTCQGTMLAVVSLMKDDSVEVRLLKPAPQPPPDAGPELTPGFGLFSLKRRQRSTCDF